MGCVVSNEELGHLTPLRYTAKLTWTSHGNSKFVDSTIKNVKKVLDIMKQWALASLSEGNILQALILFHRVRVCAARRHILSYLC